MRFSRALGVGLTVLFTGIYFQPALAKDAGFSVARILPTGDNTEQLDSVNITFSKNMVAIGDYEKTPHPEVEITPAAACEWRWISASTLSCKLSEAKALKLATSYSVTVKKTFRDSDGQVLGRDVHHHFSTARPTVSYNGFRSWLGPGYPVLYVSLNMKVTAGSLARSLSLVEDGKTAVAVRVLPKVYNQNSFYGVEGIAKLRKVVQMTASPREVAKHFWVVPARELKGNALISLHIRPGLKSPLGPLTGQEDKEVVGFSTFDSPHFVSFSCGQDHNEQALPLPLSAECNPLEGIRLNFSVPVTESSLKKACRISPMKDDKALAAYWDEVHLYSDYSEAPGKGRAFPVNLPPLMKSKTTFTVKCSNQLQDIFGRAIAKPFQVQFTTASREPQLFLGTNIGILEKNIDSEIPVYVTNMQQADIAYSLFSAEGTSEGEAPLELQKVEDLSYSTPLNVRKILQGKSGTVYVNLDGPGEDNNNSYPPRFGFFEVTPFYVHMKEGHYNSVVWVNDFATGKPVVGAEVSLLRASYAMMSQPEEQTALGKTGADGVATIPGYVSYDPYLSYRGYSFESGHLMILVKKGQDIAVLPLTYDFQVYPRWSADADYSSMLMHQKFGHVKIWGSSPQGVYRAGDSVDYKIYVRGQNELKLIPAPKEKYSLVVTDPTGKEVFKQENIKLNEFGSFSGSFKTAKSAAVGWYQFHVNADFLNDSANSDSSEEGSGTPGLISHKVLITDFTPAPFHPENDLDKVIYFRGDKMTVNTRAKLHSGGPFGDAKTRINVTLQGTEFVPQGKNIADSFRFQCGSAIGGDTTLYEKEGKLNAKGEQSNIITLTENRYSCGKMIVTSDIADERGKFYSAVKQASYFSVGRFLGLREDQFLHKQNEDMTMSFVVLDIQSRMLPEIPVSLRMSHQVVKKVRVKGAGNAYLEQSQVSWEQVGDCKMKSALKPQSCRFHPSQPGYYRVIGTVVDAQGNANENTQYIYVTGKDAVAWEESDNNSLRIVAEKQNPKVGEKARYLIQNPYPGADALITVERYGILKSWTQKFTTSTPVVEFPVTEDMLPGFHLSVVVFSPRVAQPLGEGQVDLGKPSFKMGYIKVIPDNPVKELTLKINTDNQEYRPGAKVKVALQAGTRSSRPMEKVEYAVAVLDEAVFDLIKGGDNYFDVYKGFYDLDPLDVNNYSLLMQLVGRQKFEKKGANSGGDGGGMSMRSLFKYVAYWNPSLVSDSGGKAQFEFQVPDNLTGWRILVMAVTPEDRMGLGQGSFKVNRPTELRPVMPNVVLEGDRFKGSFSVMNRTEKARDLQVTVTASGDLSASTKDLLSRTVHAKPFQRQILSFDVAANFLKEDRLVEGGNIHFIAKAGDKVDQDGLVFDLPVHKKRSFLSEANYGTTTDNKVIEKVAFPKDIYTDVGHLSVNLSGTVIGNIESAFSYMRSYPYFCWEQRLSKGVMADSYDRLKNYIDLSFTWKDSAQLTRSMLEDASGFQAPNGGMCYFEARNELVSPYLSAYTALAFAWLKERGLTVPSAVWEHLNGYLLDMLRTDVHPDFYSAGMSSTTRAVALAALAKEKTLKPSDLERYKSHLKEMDLFGKAHYLMAALSFADKENLQKEALTQILAAADESGGKFRFTESLDYGWTRIHSSELRTQCAILSALSLAAQKPWAQKMIADVPFKIVRAITQVRKATRERWENTQENMFCAEALVDYSRRYESTAPKMKINVSLNGKSFGGGEIKSFTQKELNVKRPLQSSDPGTRAEVQIERSGQGRLYYATLLNYAPKEDFKKTRDAGIEVRREYMVQRNGKFVLLSSPLQVKQGEIVRVDLYLNLPSSRSFVVVNDPVPGGFEVLNEDLANTSDVDLSKAKEKIDSRAYMWQVGNWNYFSTSYSGFYHREIRFDSVRFYSEYLEKGRYQLSYMAQVIAQGQFAVPPAHAEEMYDPDVFGKSPGSELQVAAP